MNEWGEGSKKGANKVIKELLLLLLSTKEKVGQMAW